MDQTTREDRFAELLWRLARAHIAINDREIIKSLIFPVVQMVHSGEIDPISRRETIAGLIYSHIILHTANRFGNESCSICRFQEACDTSVQHCDCYEPDIDAFDSCRENLFAAINKLDRVYGLKANVLIQATQSILDNLKTEVLARVRAF